MTSPAQNPKFRGGDRVTRNGRVGQVAYAEFGPDTPDARFLGRYRITWDDGQPDEPGRTWPESELAPA